MVKSPFDRPLQRPRYFYTGNNEYGVFKVIVSKKFKKDLTSVFINKLKVTEIIFKITVDGITEK